VRLEKLKVKVLSPNHARNKRIKKELVEKELRKASRLNNHVGADCAQEFME
jgi:hypothetical protein